jgi:hypothetical protein
MEKGSHSWVGVGVPGLLLLILETLVFGVLPSVSSHLKT